MNASKLFPGAVVFLTAIYFVIAMMAPADAEDDFHYQEFGRLPVVDRGRIKPVDTFARTNLMIVSEKQSFKEFRKWEDFLDGKAKTATALKWFLDSIAYSEPIEVLIDHKKAHDATPASFYHRVLRIENDQVLNFLELAPRPGFFRYSLAELQPRFLALFEESERVHDIDPKNHNLYDAKILLLEKRIGVFDAISKGSSPLVVPPARGDKDWASLRQGVHDLFQKQNVNDPALRSWLVMLMAYRDGDVKTFNKTLDAYSKSVGDIGGSRIGLEVFFNNFDPFFHCAVVYAVMFLLACLSWIVWPSVLNRTVFWSLILVVFVHTFALIGRMVIQDRPPVTNLYSSAIFIGWTSVITCLSVERFYRNSLALAVGSIVGFCTLIIAYYWSLEGDTLEMMQAVLDTNFWLATHVTTVTFGYSATIVAGFMGIAYIVLGLFTPLLGKGVSTHLSKATYGVICFAMFLSFVGTVLGGIWADQSWGRFWGWDPKENGALLIVIWNALILHARWAGLVKQRGVAVLAVVGNIITAWSWVGTNQLGVGLHSYGSTNGTLMVMLAFDASMGVVICMGMIPLRYWRSFWPNPPQTPNPRMPVAKTAANSVAV